MTFLHGEEFVLGLGQRPSICLHPIKDIAVTVYCQMDSLLHCQVGSVDKQRMKVNWSASFQYDTGRYPSVDFFSSHDMLYIIEVHRSLIFNSCYYHVGLVNEAKMSVDWGKSRHLGRGTKPKVCAKEDGTVVIIKEESNVLNQISYHVGRVNVDDRIIVGIEHCRPIDQIRGVQPDITINKRNHVVVVWRNGQSRLEYMTGTLRDDNSAVDWGESHNYDTGTDPTVSINNNDNVFSCYQSKLFRKLYARIGIFDDSVPKPSITWDARHQVAYTYGMHPCVSLSDSGFLLKSHESNLGRNVFYSGGKLVHH